MSHDTLNICHLGKYYPPAPGGIETHVQTLARAQAALGANVRVVCTNHADGSGQDVTHRRGATPTVDEQDGAVRVTRMGRRMTVARFDVIPTLPQLLKDLQQSEIDVIHLHTPNPTMLLTVAALRLTVPLVITHHSDIVRQRVLRHFMSPFERLAYSRATTIFTDSDDYMRGSTVLQRYLPKVVALPLGLPLQDWINPSPKAIEHAARLRAEYGQPLWLAVGRCVYYKGFDVALEALRHVPGRLMVIGHGPLQKELQSFAQRLGVSERVVWRGYADQDELCGAYHAATAFWFPSNARSEAFGLVQVEAMASECPVINTEIPGSGVAWVSLHDVSGLTTKVNDAAGFAAAANRLLSEPGLRARLATGALERAKAEFDHMQMAERSLDLYRRALHRSAKVVAGDQPAEPDLADWVRQTSSQPE
jgi:rhamnosyl/mannosyltransferase